MNVTIKIKMKNVEVELTQQEAFELRDILTKICGGENKVIVSTPYYVPVYPNTTLTTGNTGTATYTVDMRNQV